MELKEYEQRGKYTHTPICIKKIGRKWRAQFEAWETENPKFKPEFTIWADSENALNDKIDNFFNDKKTNMNHKEQIEREAEKWHKMIEETGRPADHFYLRDAVVHGANFALEMEMWVKCSAQMPYDTDYVLVTDGVYIDVMHYNVHKRVWGSDVITPTHWQPLPKLPQ